MMRPGLRLGLSRCSSFWYLDTVPPDLHAPTVQPRRTLTGWTTAGERHLSVLNSAQIWIQTDALCHKVCEGFRADHF